MKTKARTSLITLFAIAAITPVSIHIYQWCEWKIDEDKRPRPTTAELATELASIPVAGLSFGRTTFDRVSSVGATQSVDTEVSTTQVMENTKKSLLAQGWSLRKEVTEPTPSAYFCRNGRSFVIEPITQSGRTLVAISLTWTFYKAAMSYCP